METVPVKAMWNSGEVEAVNAAIVTLNDLFENYPQYQNEASVRRHSAVYYSYLLGREFTMGNVEKTEYYADKMAENYNGKLVTLISMQYREVCICKLRQVLSHYC